MAFTPPTKIAAIPEAPPMAQPYVHGYTEEQVHRIETARLVITKRDLVEEPVTLEEFRDIIAPWFRIHRTTEFTLKSAKELEKEKKPPKAPKEPKPKKLTKKQRADELSRLILKMAMGQEFTPEETAFYNSENGE